MLSLPDLTRTCWALLSGTQMCAWSTPGGRNKLEPKRYAPRWGYRFCPPLYPLGSPKGLPEGLYPLEFPGACTLLDSPEGSPRGDAPLKSRSSQRHQRPKIATLCWGMFGLSAHGDGLRTCTSHPSAHRAVCGKYVLSNPSVVAQCGPFHSVDFGGPFWTCSSARVLWTCVQVCSALPQGTWGRHACPTRAFGIRVVAVRTESF